MPFYVRNLAQSRTVMHDFKVVILSTVESSEKNNAIKLHVSGMPKIDVDYRPLISLFEFLCYVLSGISFWLGLSPLPFFKELTVRNGNETTRKISGKRKRKG